MIFHHPPTHSLKLRLSGFFRDVLLSQDASKCLAEVYSRGVDGRAVHQRGVVVVFDKVSLLGLPFTLFWLVSDDDLSVV